ncbi:MAG: ABC-2 family transporter protein [Acidimicrobiia bacterium]
MSRFTHSLKVALIHWRLGAEYEVQYRLNFVLQVVESGVRLVTGIVAIRLVFAHTLDLQGWSQPELLAVLGVHILLGGVMGTFVLPNMYTFMHEVGEGELDFALVRPVDSQIFISTRQLRFWNVVDIVIGVIVLGWALSGLGDRVGPAGALAFGFVLVCGAVILYCVWIAFTTTAVWLIDVDEMAGLLNGLYDAGRWPIRVYPAWLQAVLTVIVPMGVAITVPAEALTGRLTPTTLALLLLITIVVAVTSRLFWRFGVRHYSGASA